MTFQRNWKLQQLGITLWALRRPIALQGTIVTPLPANVRLVMISNELPVLNKTLISDVLRTLKISPDQVLQLTPDRVKMLLPNSRCNSWQLGTKQILMLEGSHLVSPVLEELERNPDAKIALWQQICNFEHNLLLCEKD